MLVCTKRSVTGKICHKSRLQSISLCTSVFSVSLWFTISQQKQPQRHRGHGGCTEKRALGDSCGKAQHELNDLLTSSLRCPDCGGSLQLSGTEIEGTLTCISCSLSFPIENGIPRMLLPAIRAAFQENESTSAFDAKQAKTALSFGYEWSCFHEMYAEWEKQFLDYMQPHGPEFFKGKKV